MSEENKPAQTTGPSEPAQDEKSNDAVDLPEIIDALVEWDKTFAVLAKAAIRGDKSAVIHILGIASMTTIRLEMLQNRLPDLVKSIARNQYAWPVMVRCKADFKEIGKRLESLELGKDNAYPLDLDEAASRQNDPREIAESIINWFNALADVNDSEQAMKELELANAKNARAYDDLAKCGLPEAEVLEGQRQLKNAKVSMNNDVDEQLHQVQLLFEKTKKKVEKLMGLAEPISFEAIKPVRFNTLPPMSKKTWASWEPVFKNFIMAVTNGKPEQIKKLRGLGLSRKGEESNIRAEIFVKILRAVNAVLRA